MKVIALLVFSLFFWGCSSLRVATDYNPDFIFEKLSTYAIVHKEKIGDNTLKNDRIKRAIHEQMELKGYQTTSRDSADFLILFHTDVTTRKQIDTSYRFVGIYPYYYGFHSMMLMPSTRTHTYKESKLIVDMVDPSNNKIIWRAVATDRCPDRVRFH